MDSKQNDFLAHYLRPDVQDVIVAASELEGSYRALIAGSDGWYTYREKNGIELKSLRALNASNYQSTIPHMLTRHRSLYWSLNFFDEGVFDETVPKDSAVSPGGFEQTKFYGLGIDIDLKDAKKVEGLTRDRDVENDDDRAMLERAIQFVYDWLIGKGLHDKIIKPMFSGNGGYVIIAPEIVKLNGNAQQAARVCGAFNAIIKQVEREFFHECPEAERFVQFDALNNRKRQWKTILSIHKSKPFACVTLDRANIKIELERTRLPISEAVVGEAKRMFEFIPLNERDEYTRELLTLFKGPIIDKRSCLDLIGETRGTLDEDDVKELRGDKISAALVARMKEIRDTGVQRGEFAGAQLQADLDDVDGFPPCVRRALGDPSVAAHARGRAFVASVFGRLRMDEAKAKEKYYEICGRGGDAPHIFKSWYGKLDPPECAKIKTIGEGYPHMEMGDMGICQPDELCAQVHHPLEYMARKKSSISFDGEHLHVPIFHDGDEMGEVRIERVARGWEHVVSGDGSVYKITASTPLGIGSSPASEDRVRRWLKSCVARKMDKGVFAREVWSRIKSDFTFSGAVHDAEAMPRRESLAFAGMFDRVTIRRQVDEEINFPVLLDVTFNGRKGTLRLNTRELLQPSSMRVAFVKTFHSIPAVLENMDDLTLIEAINFINSAGKITEITEEESSERYVQQLILNEIQGSRPTTDVTEAASMGRTILWQDDKVWISNRRISQILRAERMNVAFRKVRVWMSEYMAGNAKRLRAGSELIQFWPFDMEKCGIDREHLLEQLEKG